MIVHRISSSKYIRDLSGYGAWKYGGRWNSPGVAVIYTSESRALTVLELAVHTPLAIAPDGYQLIELEISMANLHIHTAEKLPDSWNAITPSAACQKIGDEFIEQGKFLLMKVPSAVVPGDYNLLINPSHQDMKMVRIIRISDFTFDERLVG